MFEALLKRLSLLNWFYSNFTVEEQNFIISKCADVFCVPFDTSCVFLSECIPWLNKKDNYNVLRKIVDKLELTLDARNIDCSTLHYIYDKLISFFYKNREKDDCIEKAIFYCKQQIAISSDFAEYCKNDPFMPSHNNVLPSHRGYTQLAIIYKKQKMWQSVIDVCNDAIANGYGTHACDNENDYAVRIEEAKKHLAKEMQRTNDVSIPIDNTTKKTNKECWQCQLCGTDNFDMLSMFCFMCGAARKNIY